MQKMNHTAHLIDARISPDFVIRHSSSGTRQEVQPAAWSRHSGFVIRHCALLLASAAPLLCSCRAPIHATNAATPMRAGSGPVEASTAPSFAEGTLPSTAYTGHPGDGFTRPGAVPAHMRPPGWEPPTAIGPPLPRMVYGPWAPPGIAVPWPEQEYLRDGGDRDTGVIVRDDWRVDGLDLEDTVAHFDTLDGRTLVEPSNQICLYAPRFAAVRRVDNVFEGEQRDQVGNQAQPMTLAGQEEKLFAAAHLQPVQAVGDREARRANIAQQRDVGVPVFTVLVPQVVQDSLKPHEDFTVFRTGVLEAMERPLLAKAAAAAVVWETKQAVQIILEGKRAQTDTSVQAPMAVFRVDERGGPKLQLCKTASATSALPGEEIDFTLRFDNVGGQTIGNVTILDNLTTRLEYVADSAQSSVKANFSAVANEGESLTLRWEIVEPLKPGDGGLVRFKCRVR
jgi:uncharacterized repeat protein (TIGR01451 family)